MEIVAVREEILHLVLLSLHTVVVVVERVKDRLHPVLAALVRAKGRKGRLPVHQVATAVVAAETEPVRLE